MQTQVRKYGTHDPTEDHHRQRNTIAYKTPWRLLAHKHITRNDTTKIPKANLDSQTNSRVVVPAQFICQPHNRHWLHDIATRRDEENGHVTDTKWQATLQRGLAYQDDVADAREHDAEHDEAVPVPEAVGEIRDNHGGGSGGGPDRDALYLTLEAAVT
ncbi:hypothetical protein PABG_11471 [Paracoccidioides brasiliensis Pb03]|nr:hypothetical protein PABG_11471 [Paracoccidioides brasiliensis Pb03]